MFNFFKIQPTSSFASSRKGVEHSCEASNFHGMNHRIVNVSHIKKKLSKSTSNASKSMCYNYVFLFWLQNPLKYLKQF